MSKLLENKQIIHVGAEIVALAGLTFYFSTQNKKLLGHISAIAQQLEEQKRIVNNHENSIKSLVKQVNLLSCRPITKHFPIQSKRKKERKERQINTNSVNRVNVRPASSPVDGATIEVIEERSDTDGSGDDSNLDAEIEEELNELKERGLNDEK
jgi:hypothetical protein